MADLEPRVILRMGTHAEKEYFEKTLRLFDGLALNANLVEATPGATASLLVRFAGFSPSSLSPSRFANERTRTLPKRSGFPRPGRRDAQPIGAGETDRRWRRADPAGVAAVVARRFVRRRRMPDFLA